MNGAWIKNQSYGYFHDVGEERALKRIQKNIDKTVNNCHSIIKLFSLCVIYCGHYITYNQLVCGFNNLIYQFITLKTLSRIHSDWSHLYLVQNHSLNCHHLLYYHHQLDLQPMTVDMINVSTSKIK